MKRTESRRRLSLGADRLLGPGALAFALVLSSLLVLVSCGVTHELDREAFEEVRPRRIAVLPFYSTEPNERDIERALYAREVFQEQLTILPFAFLETVVVDARLKHSGLELQQAAHVWEPERLEVLGVDAVLIGEIDPYSATDFGLFSKEGLSGRFQLVSVPTGRRLWQAEYSLNNFGGLLLGSGQVIREIRRFANSSDEIYIAAVDEFTADVVAVFPSDAVKEDWQTESLEIRSFEVTPSRQGTLRTGDSFELRLEGTTGMRVSARCGPFHKIPLFEVEPGRYVGSHIVVRGEQFTMSDFEAVLSSPFGGVIMETVSAAAPIQADSRPPAIRSVTASADGQRIEFDLEEPRDAVKFVLETRSGTWREGSSPTFDLSDGEQPSEPLFGYVIDAVGNRSRSIPVGSTKKGEES